jgi:hypothetical protein
MATLHEWVQSLFPDVPPKLEENSVEERYYFRNSFTGSAAICEFRKNEVSEMILVQFPRIMLLLL